MRRSGSMGNFINELDKNLKAGHVRCNRQGPTCECENIRHGLAMDFGKALNCQGTSRKPVEVGVVAHLDSDLIAQLRGKVCERGLNVNPSCGQTHLLKDAASSLGSRVWNESVLAQACRKGEVVRQMPMNLGQRAARTEQLYRPDRGAQYLEDPAKSQQVAPVEGQEPEQGQGREREREQGQEQGQREDGHLWPTNQYIDSGVKCHQNERICSVLQELIDRQKGTPDTTAAPSSAPVATPRSFLTTHVLADKYEMEFGRARIPLR